MDEFKIATPEDVDKLLTVDENKLKKIREDQLKMLLSSRSRISPEERIRAYAVVLEEHYRNSGNKEGLAESLALQGRYHEAVELTDDDLRKKEYKEKAEALTNSTKCSCPDTIKSGSDILPSRYTEYALLVEGKGEVIKFIRCTICNKLFTDNEHDRETSTS
jgi:hypothetical protein